MSVLMAMALAGGADADWGARLARDADRFQAVVLDSHPGPVDPENPGFKAKLEAAHARATERARTATSHAHYTWALNELTAAFEDGHLGINVPDAPGPRAYRWAGFMTRIAGGRHVVSVSDEPVIPVGATLIACDGRDADALAAERVGRFFGGWSLRSSRERMGGVLFMPSDNPWNAPLARCAFDVAGARREVALTWRPVDTERVGKLADAAFKGRMRHRSPVSLERLADGSFWVNMGSFESDPQAEAGRALTALNAEIGRRAGELRRAPRVVFDLRGNNGGSSSWINQAAGAIWGEGALKGRVHQSEGIDWRVSDANVAAVREYHRMFESKRETDPALYKSIGDLADGLARARSRGAVLWREPDGLFPEPEGGPVHAVGARAFVLTDEDCASACLDAVDVLTAMGATQVGRETSADTLYMEVRYEKTPDGARIWVPMKVYRGRPRGSNVPAVPKHEWTGEMGDTAGIRRWVASL